MNYDALIKRMTKAIEVAKNIVSPAAVHKVTIDDDIEKLTGLVIVLHPEYVESKNQKQTAQTPDKIEI